ncbi:MAG: nucleoside permease [Methylococcaceae bacterium]|nr:nucleoside permease [Prolixibacteraceae bacterium]
MLGIKNRLIIMNFLQFFIWGAWLISIGVYLSGTLGFNGVQIGAVFSTLGLASLFMPAVMGIIADKWINAERLLGICHLIGALLLFWASTITDPDRFFYVILFYAMFYMPTIALNSTVSYIVLEQKGYDVVKDFPPIRVWGTVGFIAAMWIVDLFGWKGSNMQLVFSGCSSIALGLYAFSMPACKPENTNEKKSLASRLGLDALVLFKQSRMAVFFLFAMFLGAALQITNAFGSSFLESFNLTHPDTFGVKHPIVLLSISQMSETLFILTIPFFLRKFGIKKVMIISIFAWVLRFGLFSIGDPGQGLYLLILSMIVYGMAFDFFNISGSLFVEKEVPSSYRASAQGIFMLVTNGVGATLGGYGSGVVVDYFTRDGVSDWPTIWLCFASYALVLGLIFPLAFKYKHKPEMVASVL